MMFSQFSIFKNKLQISPNSAVLLLTALLFLIFNALFPSLQFNPQFHNYFYLEEIGLKLLSAFILAVLSINQLSRLSIHYSFLLGLSLGLLYFTYTLGYQIVDPTQIHWVMHGDWEFSFMGWQFFRQEAWQFPPGKINTFFYPVGSSLGYTDSIPLLGFFFKIFRAILPEDFQYVGLWLCSCFVLQGVFAAKLLRLFTPKLLLQALGISFFVLSPILLNRIWHAALCAHWLILAGLWLYFTPWRPEKMRRAGVVWLGLLVLAAMIHPYLVMMVVGLVAAFYLRMFWVERYLTWQHTALHLACLGSALIFTWWLTGYFVIRQANMSAAPLGYYSLNLLALLNSADWSIFIRRLPTVTDGQIFEGFSYFGLGGLILLLWAVYELSQRPPQPHSYRLLLPLGLGCLVLTLLAISPKVTLGDITLLELNSFLFQFLTPFQSSGRFFWVAYYALLLLVLQSVITRQRLAASFLGFALLWQALDFSVVVPSFRERHFSENWYQWQNTLKSPIWDQAAPHYRHITFFMPSFCGEEAAPYLPFADLARRHQLSLNTGRAARFNFEQSALYCQALNNILETGVFSDEDIYIVNPHYLVQLQKNAQPPLLCGEVDGVTACVTEHSYRQWAAPSNKP